MKRLVLAFALVFPSLSVLAGTPIDETRPLSPTATVEIENLKGKIVVSGWERNEAHIGGMLGEGVEKLLIEGDGDRLRVKVEYPESGGSWFGWGGDRGGEPSTLEIKLPRTVALQIDSVSADVQVRDISGKTLSIDSVSGDIDVDAAPGEVDIDSVSGDQNIRIDSADVALESVSGDITLRGAFGEQLDVETVSGDIDAATAALKDADIATVSGNVRVAASVAAGGRVQAEAVSGDLALRVPAGASLRLEASSFSGSIRSSAGAVEKPKYGPGASLAATLGSGGAEIELETFSGDIEFEQQ